MNRTEKIKRIVLPGFEGATLSNFFTFRVAGFTLIFGKMAINRFVEMHIVRKSLLFYLIMTLKWIVIGLVILLAISFIYWLAPAKKSEFRFISPGSVVATGLFIITSLGFSAYVNNWGQYNILYGSIGTFIMILEWLYLNSIALLTGFELNMSIKAAVAGSDNKGHPETVVILQ